VPPVSRTQSGPIDTALAAGLGAEYRLLDRLGAGEMGTVFLAEQPRVGHRHVALKVLHPQFSADPELMTRFENVAAATGRIRHPNVVTVYEVKRAAHGRLYIAMEWVEGESLADALEARGPFPLDEVVEIVRQCGQGLQAAHRVGVIHGDLNPRHIMLTRDLDEQRLVKLLDFGSARLREASGLPGSSAYLSYEQACGLAGADLDERSDVYGLGLVTYAMLLGHPPFQAATRLDAMARHLFEAPPPLPAERPEVSAAVDAVVMKALEKVRPRRYQTVGEFALALRQAANTAEGGEEARAVPSSRQSAAPPAAQRPVPGGFQPVAMPVGPRAEVPSTRDDRPSSPYAPPWRRRLPEPGARHVSGLPDPGNAYPTRAGLDGRT